MFKLVLCGGVAGDAVIGLEGGYVVYIRISL